MASESEISQKAQRSEAPKHPDRGDFLACFNSLERPLRSYLYSVTVNIHDMDDLAQNVWRVLWQKFDEYDRSRPFSAWAFGVARLEALKWRQRQARSRLVLDEHAISRLAEAAAESAPEIDARSRFLPECLDSLHFNYRQVLDLKYAVGLKIAAIAEQLGRTVPAVEMALVRARRRLRACVRNKMRMQGMEGT